MAFTCIPAQAAKTFKDALKGRDISISDLLKMTTEERTAFFEKYAGPEAQAMNTLFEEKLVLKNKVAGLKNFIQKVTQEGRYSAEKKAELARAAEDFRALQQKRIFSPSEEQTFLNDLVDKIEGVHFTKDEAATLFSLTSRVDDLLKSNFHDGEWTSPEAGAEYGATKVVMDHYVEGLKEPDATVKGMVKDRLAQFKEDLQTNTPHAVVKLIGDTIKTISDNSISLVATLDNSFIGRQGLKTLMTHPSVWWKGARASFSDIAGQLGGKNMKDALTADIYSNPNYINGAYDLAKLIPKREEQYPGSLADRIWGVGRVLKASEVAFEGSAIRMRTGLYDLLAEQAKNNGVDMTDKYQIQSLGKMINSLTARGAYGSRGEPAIVRVILWAPKMLKANFDVLTAHTGQDISSFARKQAALNLTKIVATTAAIMTIANAVSPGSAETDPRSTNFGKIKVGNTSFDYTGGAGSLLVLASRLVTGASKTTGSNIVKPFGTGYGQQTRFDALIDFLVGKTTPPISAAIALMKGATYTGAKPTIASTAESLVVPISIQNAIQLKDDSSASAILGVILDGFGVNANTYIAGQADWSTNPTQELQAFQKKVGDTKFTAANDAFNKEYQTWFTNVQKDPRYTVLSDDDKQKVITTKKSKLRTQVLAQYGFHYKAPPSKPLPKF